MRVAGMRLRRNQHRHHSLSAGLHVGRNVKDAAHEGSARRAHLHAVDPDGGGIIDALEVQPDALTGVVGGNLDCRSIPIRRARQALGNNLRPVVFTVKRFEVNMVVYQGRQHRSGNRGCIPARRIEAACGNLRARLRRFGHVLHLPARGQGDRLWLRGLRWCCNRPAQKTNKQ